MIQVLGGIALNSTNEMAQAAAADKALGWIIPRPAAEASEDDKGVTINGGLPD